MPGILWLQILLHEIWICILNWLLELFCDVQCCFSSFDRLIILLCLEILEELVQVNANDSFDNRWNILDSHLCHYNIKGFQRQNLWNALYGSMC